MQDGEAPLVDTHFHAWDATVPVMPDAFYRPAGDAPVEAALAAMDAHGVAFGVVAAASLHGVNAEYLRHAVKTNRRLRATAIVDPSLDIAQLRQMKDDGFVGIRLVWGHLDQPPDIRSDAYARLLRRVVDLDWHVHFHEREDRIPGLIETLEARGVRKIVLDHFGRIEGENGVGSEAFKAILAAVDRGRTWVKLSGGFRFDSPAKPAAFARELLRVNGGDRLVWGSDWPFAAFEDKVTYADTIAALEEWAPDPEVRRKIGGETALRLFFT